MTRILIAYGTNEGQTGRIAEYLAQVIREQGLDADLVDIRCAGTPDPDRYDAVIVGASVHMGKHQKYVRRFTQEHRAALEHLPSAFFSVSLAACDSSENARKEVDRYIQEFVQETGWRPAKVGAFAGALLYTRYGFITRWIMRKIARKKGSPDLDTSRDYSYTNWDAVRQFGQEFLESQVPEAAISGCG